MVALQPYLGGAVDRSFTVHYDGPLCAVTVKLHRVELAEFYRSRVADGSHAGAHIKPAAHEQSKHLFSLFLLGFFVLASVTSIISNMKSMDWW